MRELRGKMLHWLMLVLAWAGLSGAALAQELGYVQLPAALPGEDSDDLVFYYYKYTDARIDLSHFKRLPANRERDIPESIDIVLPDMRGFQDTVIAVGFLRDYHVRDRGIVLVMVIGDYQTDAPGFFVDIIMDRNFANDGRPLIFEPLQKRHKVKFLDTETGKRHVFFLMNPVEHRSLPNESLKTPEISEVSPVDADQVFPLADEQVQSAVNLSKKRMHRFAIWGDFFVGFGKLHYDYEKVETGYPVDYRNVTTPKGVALGLAYEIKNVRIGLTGSYDNYYYWTSRRRERIGENYIHCTNTGAGEDCRVINNVMAYYNEDVKAKNKYSLALEVGYNIELSRTVRLMPYLAFAGYTYNDNRYRPDRLSPVSYEMVNKYSYGGGVVLMAKISDQGYLTTRVNFVRYEFEPEGFFRQEAVTNLNASYRQVTVGIGYLYYVIDAN